MLTTQPQIGSWLSIKVARKGNLSLTKQLDLRIRSWTQIGLLFKAPKSSCLLKHMNPTLKKSQVQSTKKAFRASGAQKKFWVSWRNLVGAKKAENSVTSVGKKKLHGTMVAFPLLTRCPGFEFRFYWLSSWTVEIKNKSNPSAAHTKDPPKAWA